MNLQAIQHIPVSNYAFPVSEKEFKVRLRVTKGDLDRARLVIGNKYLWHTRKEFPMEVAGSEGFRLLRVCVPSGRPPHRYYFILDKGDESGFTGTTAWSAWHHQH